MKIRSMAPVLAVGVLYLGLAGCAPAQQATPEAGPTRVVIHADWPSYPSLEALAGKADLVVRGTVISQEVAELNIRMKPGNPDDPVLNPGGDMTPKMAVYTVYTIKVSDCYKGCDGVEDTVKMKVQGGTFDGVDYVLEDAPQFKENKKYILFLAVYPDIPASLLNPTQSAFDENGDGVNPKNPYKLPPGQVKKLFE